MTEEDSSSTINSGLPDSLAASYLGSNTRSKAVQSSESPSSTVSGAKTKQNAAILQASLDVSITSKNQPLALLLKSAISGINDLLKPQFGDNAIQAAASQDNSPDGTASRIVSVSTGFYELFKQQHPNEDPKVVLKNFMDTIRSGFENGAKEAQNILNGMGVLSGDISSNIDKTLALVRQGYADFEASQSSRLSTAPESQKPRETIQFH